MLTRLRHLNFLFKIKKPLTSWDEYTENIIFNRVTSSFQKAKGVDNFSLPSCTDVRVIGCVE